MVNPVRSSSHRAPPERSERHEGILVKKLLIALLAVLLMAASCSSSGTSESADDSASTEETSDSSAESDETAEAAVADDASVDGTSADDGRFVYANGNSLIDIDPAAAFVGENVVLQNVYESLTRFNPPGSAEQLSGVLAESWEPNEDGTVWTFKLREGVTFHDGAPLTAEAVRASLQRTMDLGLGASFILFAVDSMEVIDDLTIQFNLVFPTAFDLIMSATYGAYIMSPTAVTQDSAWFNEGNASGTGPYTLESYSPSEGAELVRFDDYWAGWTDGQFDTIEIQQVSDDAVLRDQLLRNGDADFSTLLPYDIYDSLEGVDGLRVERFESMENLFGALNTTTLSPAVREALVLSFPYDAVTESLFGGRGTRARGIVPQAVWGSHPDLALPQTDLERAAEILEAEGLTDLSIRYGYGADSLDQQAVGEVWAANLSSIGVELVLEAGTFDARLEQAQSDPEGSVDVFMLLWFPTFVTPYDFLFTLFHSEEFPFFNLSYYSNEEFDALIDDGDAASGTDQAAAVELFRQAQDILIEDDAAVFVVDLPGASVINDSILGYVPNPAYSGVVFFHELRQG